jgi:hypothetical protein
MGPPRHASAQTSAIAESGCRRRLIATVEDPEAIGAILAPASREEVAKSTLTVPEDNVAHG